MWCSKMFHGRDPVRALLHTACCKILDVTLSSTLLSVLCYTKHAVAQTNMRISLRIMLDLLVMKINSSAGGSLLNTAELVYIERTKLKIQMEHCLYIPCRTARMKQLNVNATTKDSGSQQAASTSAVTIASARSRSVIQIEQETNDLMDDVSSPAPKAPKPRAPAAAKVSLDKTALKHDLPSGFIL